jgi:3-hydroxyisobutyrate dehydrogenase
MISFLGTGLLGSGFVRAALKRGEKVNVWNRTIDRAAALGREGAAVFPVIADAVKGAARVHLVLSDDASVDSVIKQVLPALANDAVIVDHTSTSVKGAVARTQSLAALGVLYQHCPVFMSPQNALESSGIMLISGEEARYARLKSSLEAMTGKLVYFGADAGRAAAMKLAGNLMLMAITTGLADAAAFLKALDIPRAELNTLFESFNPGASVQPRAKRMLTGSYDSPSWELNMARKDARLILAEAAGAVPALAMVPHYAALMDMFIAQGFGHSDWTVIGKEAL